MGMQRDMAQEHREEIIALWHQGVAIRNIAARFRSSQAVISGLLEEEGLRSQRPHSRAAQRHLRREALLAWVRANPGSTRARAAQANGLTYALVVNYLQGTPEYDLVIKNRDHAGIRQMPGPRRTFTDEEMLEHLRRIWETLSEQSRQAGLGPALYRVVADADAPSAALYERRFGSWRQACAAAGIRPAPPIRKHYARLPDEALLEAVRTYLQDGGHSYQGYMRWAQRTGAPSGSLVRNRIGTWPEILQRALARGVA